MRIEDRLDFSEETIWFQSFDNPDDKGYLEKITPILQKPGFVDIEYRKLSALNAIGFLRRFNLKTIPSCPAEFIEMIPAGLCGNRLPVYLLLKGTNNSSLLLNYIQNDLSKKIKRIQEENEELELKDQLAIGTEKIRKLETENEIKSISKLLKKDSQKTPFRRSSFRNDEE